MLKKTTVLISAGAVAALALALLAMHFVATGTASDNGGHTGQS